MACGFCDDLKTVPTESLWRGDGGYARRENLWSMGRTGALSVTEFEDGEPVGGASLQAAFCPLCGEELRWCPEDE